MLDTVRAYPFGHLHTLYSPTVFLSHRLLEGMGANVPVEQSPPCIVMSSASSIFITFQQLIFLFICQVTFSEKAETEQIG